MGYANNFYSNISGSLLDYLYLASGKLRVKLQMVAGLWHRAHELRR